MGHVCRYVHHERMSPMRRSRILREGVAPCQPLLMPLKSWTMKYTISLKHSPGSVQTVEGSGIQWRNICGGRASAGSTVRRPSLVRCTHVRDQQTCWHVSTRRFVSRPMLAYETLADISTVPGAPDTGMDYLGYTRIRHEVLRPLARGRGCLCDGSPGIALA